MWTPLDALLPLAAAALLAAPSSGRAQEPPPARGAGDWIAELSGPRPDEAIAGLVALGAKATAAPLVEYLASGPPAASWQAHRALRALAAAEPKSGALEDAASRLGEIAAEPGRDAELRALAALAHPTDDPDPLIPLLRDAEPEPRLAAALAVSALAAWDEEKSNVAKALLELVEDEADTATYPLYPIAAWALEAVGSRKAAAARKALERRREAEEGDIGPLAPPDVRRFVEYMCQELLVVLPEEELEWFASLGSFEPERGSFLLVSRGLQQLALLLAKDVDSLSEKLRADEFRDHAAWRAASLGARAKTRFLVAVYGLREKREK